MADVLNIDTFNSESRWQAARIYSTLSWYDSKLEDGLIEVNEEQVEYLKNLFNKAPECNITVLQFDSQCYVWRFRN